MKKTFVVFIAILVGLFLFLPAQAFQPFPDTGQTKCYDNTGEIPCPSPGQPFYGQDAQYQPRLPRSYTKLGHGGTVLPDTALHVDDGGQWIMTRDNVTGLIWELKTNDNMNDRYTWDSAQSQFINELNNATFGGFSDWRLPSIKESSSLVNAAGKPLIDAFWFPNNVSDYYWSSTTFADVTYDVWGVYFNHGGVYDIIKSYSYYVRAVRAGQPSPHCFVNHGDGTVTDTATGLMWQQCSYGQTWANGQCTGSAIGRTWHQALEAVGTLSLAEHSDWRLPNRNELQSLVDYSRFSPSIDPALDCVSDTYWSSTTIGHYNNSAWLVDFLHGFVGGHNKTYSHYVRAVRAGHSATGSIGSFLVTIEPQGALTAGAKWRVNGGAWRDSGVIQQVPAGTHTLEFMNIPGWTRPASQIISINSGQTFQINSTYFLSDVQNAVLEGVVRGTDTQGRSTGILAGASVELAGHGLQTTDSQGKYRFPGVSPGSYEVTASKSGYYPTSRRDVVMNAGDSTSLNLSLTQQSQTDSPASFNFQAPNGKHIIPGMPGTIDFSTDVSWNGSPGSVRFLINGQWHVPTLVDLGAGLARAMISLPAPLDILTPSELAIEVTNGEGVKANIPRVYIFM